MSNDSNQIGNGNRKIVSRRGFLGGLIAIGAAVSLNACSPAASPAPTSQAKQPTAAPAGGTPQFKGITLRISTQNGPSTDAWKAIIPGFESKYGATVEILEDSYNQVQPKQFAEAQAHTGAFDIIGLQTFDLGKYIVGGVVADLGPYFNDANLVMPDYDLNDFSDVFVKGYCEYEVEGKRSLYVLPHKFDIYLGIYRPDLFTGAGLKEPGESFSYDDLLAAADKIKPSHGDDPVITFPLKAPGPAFTTWSAICRSYGGEYFDANKYPLFNGEAGVTAIEKLRSMLKYLPTDVLSVDFDAALRIMSQGKAAYAENWNSFFPTILDPKQSIVTDKVKFMATPAGPSKRAQEMGGWSVGMSPDSKNPKAAFTLLQYLTAKETAVDYALAGGSSARASVANSAKVVEKMPYYPLMIAALKEAIPRPTDPAWGETQSAMGTAVSAALQPGGDAKVELTKAAQKVYQLVQRMGYNPEKTGPEPK